MNFSNLLPIKATLWLLGFTLSAHLYSTEPSEGCDVIFEASELLLSQARTEFEYDLSCAEFVNISYTPSVDPSVKGGVGFSIYFDVDGTRIGYKEMKTPISNDPISYNNVQGDHLKVIIKVGDTSGLMSLINVLIESSHSGTDENGSGNTPVNDDADVTGITISPKNLTAEVGFNAYVTGAVIPSNAANKSLWFESSDTSVATVNSSGVITAMSAGSAIITAVSSDGQYRDDARLTVSEPVYEQYNQEIDLTQFDLAWSDEFDYPDEQLEHNWESQNGATGNEFVMCSRWRENAKVENGRLVLTAKKETRAGQDWTCGNIWTKKTFTYGYFEARYTYTGASGTNNSFWLWPKNGVGPGEKAFELDVNEGHYPSEINTNVHNWTDVAADGTHPEDGQPRIFSDYDFSTEFHTFGLLWTEDKHMFYLDGELIRVEEHTLNHSPTNILLSQAILKWNIAGAVTDDIDGKSMVVDYVRYYQANDSFVSGNKDITGNDTQNETSGDSGATDDQTENDDQGSNIDEKLQTVDTEPSSGSTSTLLVSLLTLLAIGRRVWSRSCSI